MLTIGFYQKKNFSKEFRTKILILLCDIVLNDKIANVYGFVYSWILNFFVLFKYEICFRKETFKEWVEELPLLLCSSQISHHVLKTFSCLGKQQNKHFLKSFSENSSKFIGLCENKINRINLIFKS